MKTDVVIIGGGMFTPIGLSLPETAASARARVGRLSVVDRGDARLPLFSVGCVPDEALPPLCPELDAEPIARREARMLRLADPALAEALTVLPKSITHLPVFIGLPEIHTTVPINESRFLQRLKKQTGACLDLDRSRTFASGRAAALLALQGACEYLAKNPSSFVLVGGVDSQADPYILSTFDIQKRIRTANNPDGFAPGEGAGFLLLTSVELAKTHRLNPLAKVIGVGVGREEGHLYSEIPYRGEGLSAAWEQLFESRSERKPVGCVYLSFNGEHYWAKEYGVAMIRHRSSFIDDPQTEHPAECFGDLGAAHGAVLLGLAALRQNRAAPGTATLVSASSDLGDRAVVAIENYS